jgi:dephospho-CoA kinase
MLRVGLSGGIGSGKSTVSARLADLGAVLIDADRLAREVVAPGTPGLAAVAERFGPGVVAADGTLDRAALGALVFTDPGARADLEAITHPAICRRTAELMSAAAPDAVLVHDVPLLVEKQMGAAYHLVVIVAVEADERLRRLVELRGMDPDQARSRITSQAGEEQRRAAADVWLDNHGTVDDLHAAVDLLWHERLVPYERNVRHRVAVRRPERATLHDPDPSWPAQAARLAARLRRTLGDTALAVEHIGSTAIPGMPAKDVVDLQVVVPELDAVDDDAVSALCEAGFPPLPGGWWDHAHHAQGEATWPKRLHGHADPGRVAHIHLRPASSPARRLALLFRDWVTSVPQAHADYRALKVDLTGRGISTSDYAEAKEPWFAQAFDRAEAWAAETGWCSPGHRGG